MLDRIGGSDRDVIERRLRLNYCLKFKCLFRLIKTALLAIKGIKVLVCQTNSPQQAGVRSWKSEKDLRGRFLRRVRGLRWARETREKDEGSLKARSK